ncbi:hypothetical protein Pden_3191 [Paracoccus denitrificans PD1222]|uniref:Uncharacterized protein n=1 Tax=Paracoccus denitrificans (strain Pd 1222) TaxID=318586 RepID=A1B6X8_PARDP|nr:hypothetical protein Pden_3191 [Paracoccus denitrificans PD1222]
MGRGRLGPRSGVERPFVTYQISDPKRFHLGMQRGHCRHLFLWLALPQRDEPARLTSGSSVHFPIIEKFEVGTCVIICSS